MRQNVLYVCNLIELMAVLLCKCHINKYHWIVHLKFYLFLVVLSLRCLVWAFSTCGKWGLFSSCSTSVSHCGGFSCGAQALGHAGCISCSSWALIAPWHMESSWIRDGTHVPCSESSLNHWTTRKVPKMVNFYVMWISYQFFFLMCYKEAQNEKEGTPCSWESLFIIPEKEKANA